jgi:hypothetical protein
LCAHLVELAPHLVENLLLPGALERGYDVHPWLDVLHSLRREELGVGPGPVRLWHLAGLLTPGLAFRSKERAFDDLLKPDNDLERV